MDLGDLSQPRLEVSTGLVLDAPILDEEREVVLAVLSRSPAEIVDVPVEHERSRYGELVPKAFLDFSLENLESHTVNGILESGDLKRDVFNKLHVNVTQDNHLTAMDMSER